MMPSIRRLLLASAAALTLTGSLAISAGASAADGPTAANGPADPASGAAANGSAAGDAGGATRVDPHARTGGVVPGGLTGAAARNHLGAANTRFGQLQRRRSAEPADALHEAWELFPHEVANGAMATQSIDPSLDVPANGGDILYTPTLMPGRVSCVELTTIYWQDAAELGVWNWCGDTPGFDKVVGFDSSFVSTYTTSVHGRQAYTARITQTNATTNEWTVGLYNYTTSAFDTFFTSQGTTKLSGNDTGWDMWEIYTNVDPATGNGYYCPAVAGHGFESSDIQFNIGGSWQQASASNTTFYPSDSPNGAADFQCPSLSFGGNHADWTVTG